MEKIASIRYVESRAQCVEWCKGKEADTKTDEEVAPVVELYLRIYKEEIRKEFPDTEIALTVELSDEPDVLGPEVWINDDRYGMNLPLTLQDGGKYDDAPGRISWDIVDNVVDRLARELDKLADTH